MGNILKTKNNIISKKGNVIEVSDLHKSFIVGNQEIPILKGIDVDIANNEFVVIVGPSGCGKSTFLYCMLGLEEPTQGRVIFFGQNFYKDAKDEDERGNIRKQVVGMVYQQSNWIKTLTVKENVAFPLMLLGREKESAVERAMRMLKQVTMEKWAEYMPTELSSGQQQRVALARAIVNNPEIIIADEPTGNLDYDSGQKLMHLLADMRHVGKTIIMVTHDLEYLSFATMVIRMFDGGIAGIYRGQAEILKQMYHHKKRSFGGKKQGEGVLEDNEKNTQNELKDEKITDIKDKIQSKEKSNEISSDFKEIKDFEGVDDVKM